jgi:hypothetical protein
LKPAQAKLEAQIEQASRLKEELTGRSHAKSTEHATEQALYGQALATVPEEVCELAALGRDHRKLPRTFESHLSFPATTIEYACKLYCFCVNLLRDRLKALAEESCLLTRAHFGEEALKGIRTMTGIGGFEMAVQRSPYRIDINSAWGSMVKKVA